MAGVTDAMHFRVLPSIITRSRAEQYTKIVLNWVIGLCVDFEYYD